MPYRALEPSSEHGGDCVEGCSFSSTILPNYDIEVWVKVQSDVIKSSIVMKGN